MFDRLKAYWKHRAARKETLVVMARIMANPQRHERIVPRDVVKVVTKKQVKRKAVSVSGKK